MAPPDAPGDTPEAQFESTQSALLDGKGPRPVIAVPHPAWAYPDVHNVVIMGAFHTVRALSELGLQTAITVDASRNVGDPLTLHGHRVLPPDDQRYLSEGGQIATLPRTSTRVEDQLASPSRGDANQGRLWCAVRPASSYDREAALTDEADELLLIHSTTLQQPRVSHLMTSVVRLSNLELAICGRDIAPRTEVFGAG
jgi:hypothetical protein